MARLAIELKFRGITGRGGKKFAGAGNQQGASGLQGAWLQSSRVLLKNARRGGIRAMNAVSKDLLRRAQAITPELTGALVTSGRIDKRITDKLAVFVVSFGAEGPSQDYAFRVHETHQPPGGFITAQKSGEEGRAGRKFLFRPLQNNRDRYLQDIADGVQRAIRAG
jgi:hypothetical protein